MYKLTSSDSVLRLSDGAFIPNDPANIDRQEYENWIMAGNVPQSSEPLTLEQVASRIQTTAQLLLDNWAINLGYESILSLCTYSTSIHPASQEAGIKGVEMRDAVREFVRTLILDIESSKAEVPTDEVLVARLNEILYPTQP